MQLTGTYADHLQCGENKSEGCAPEAQGLQIGWQLLKPATCTNF